MVNISLVVNITPGTYDVRFFESTVNEDLPIGWITGIFGLNGTGVQTFVNCFENPPLRP